MSIAEPKANVEFLNEFLDDYFAECEEHLSGARRNLLKLERFVNQSSIDRPSIDELFRSFHSIKGISGMVGLREAEQLAHQLESYLRALRDVQAILTTEGMDALIAGTMLLEQVISEHRASVPPTDITPVMLQLEGVVSNAKLTAEQSSSNDKVSQPSSRTPGVSESAPVATTNQNGSRVWRFEFVPVPALAARGINVNVVRARLQQIGNLIHAAPRLMAGGGIAFEFFVTSYVEEATFAGWVDDGLTYALYDTRAVIPKSAAPEESGVAFPQQASSRATSNMVRVDLGRLDELMRMVGEVVISHSHLDDQVKHIEASLAAAEWRPLQDTNLTMERQLRDLREGVMRVRMVPIGEIFERMHFVVRDMAREYQKKIRLELSGQRTEIDKFLVERMMDPILHLVRNAVSHGIESESERIALRKPVEGTIKLSASATAEMAVIEIEDDGRGIDAEQVLRRAQETGLVAANSGLESTTLLDLICAPGFSTRAEADRASGRGVGMNVVQNTILGLGGAIALDTEPGRGTRFTIQLPLTLAIADALIVRVGDQRFAVPQASVREVVEVEASEIKVLENNDIIFHRGGALPLLRLARLFRLEETTSHFLHAFVIASGSSLVGVAVDRILGQREIVVRTISDPLIQVAGIGGATELGDGRVVLILDAPALARSARGMSPAR